MLTFCGCNFTSSPSGGALSPGDTWPFSVWAESFHPSYPECKVRRETSAAASSLAGYHGDRRHIFPLNLPTTHGYQKGLLSPSDSLRGQESRLPCCEEPCRICSPHRREDTASDRHGSVGAVHKGKNKCTFFLLCV